MSTASRSRTLRIALARVHHQLGWASVVGCALLVAAAAVLSSAWRDRQVAARTTSRTDSAPLQTRDTRSQANTREQAATASNALPAMSELPTLLTRLEAIAVDNQLGWAAADYRLRPASDSEPASMEIRTQLTGSYPQLRRMVSQVVDRIPGVTFRQLNFTRASSDTTDVEAKVVFAILLADGPAGASASAPARAGAGSGGAP